MIHTRNNCPENTHQVEFSFNVKKRVLIKENKNFGIDTTHIFYDLFKNTNFNSFCKCFKRVKIDKALAVLSISDIKMKEIGLNFPTVSVSWFPTYIKTENETTTPEAQLKMVQNSSHIQQQIYYPGGAFQITTIIKAQTIQEQNFYGPTRVEGFWSYDENNIYWNPYTNENVTIPFYPWYIIAVETTNKTNIGEEDQIIDFNLQWYITCSFDRYICTPTEDEDNEPNPDITLVDLNYTITNDDINNREDITLEPNVHEAYEKVTLKFQPKQKQVITLQITNKTLN